MSAKFMMADIGLQAYIYTLTHIYLYMCWFVCQLDQDV